MSTYSQEQNKTDSKPLTTPSNVQGASRIQERTGSAKDKLERHCQERPTKTELPWEEAEITDLDRQECCQRAVFGST